jgi:hypothetical protein
VGCERRARVRQPHEARIRAAGDAAIKTGEVIELGHVLNASIPLVGTRRFDVHTKRTFMNQPSNRRASNEELMVTELGQVGTQLDVFPHQTMSQGSRA